MYEILTDVETLKKYNYETAKIEKLMTKAELGLEDNVLGGNVTRAAKIKDEETYILTDRSYVKTIGVAKKKLEKKVGKEEKIEVKADSKCEACGKEFKNEFALKSHKRFCKA